MEAGVDADGPAVARMDDDVDARRVERVGANLQLGVRHVAARAQQLLVADQLLGIERVARSEEQVAAQHPFAREDVEVVAGPFEPVAVGVEYLVAFDGDRTDGPSLVGEEALAFVLDRAAAGGVDAAAGEEESVEHAGHGPAAGFRADAVVEAFGPLRGGGAHAGRVGRKELGAWRFRPLHLGQSGLHRQQCCGEDE